MNDILVLSVGTTTDPLKQCIARIRPRRVVFICSQDTRNLVDEIQRNVRIEDFDPARDVEVLSQRAPAPGDASLPSASSEIDQLHSVYIRCQDLLVRLHREEPGSRISVDYTGGTKTMATGLGLAAIDDGRVELMLTQGSRRSGASSVSGNSTPIPVDSGSIQFRRLLSDRLPALLRRHDYAAAQASAAHLLRMRLERSTAQSLRRVEDLLLAFDAWDRWDLDRAQSLLMDHAGEKTIREQFLFPLQRLIQSCDLLNPPKAKQTRKDASDTIHAGAEHLGSSKEELSAEEKAFIPVRKSKIYGFEAVEDLLLNAARRASQERYDDAVGRLYRAMELTAQLLLLIDHRRIRTGDLQLELVPEELRPALEKKRSQEKSRIELGLTASFDLLADLDDPVGIEWRIRRAEFVDALIIRNHSLLAHGFKPVNYADWQRLEGGLAGFIRSVLDGRRSSFAPLRQLPTTLEELGLVEVGSHS